MANSSSFVKSFHNLLKNIGSFSGGEARVSEWDDEDLSIFEVEIAPSGGLYKGGKFKFKIEVNVDDFPSYAPTVVCKTPVYHPNIDTIDDSCSSQEEYDNDSSNVCVSLLDEWGDDNGLDDCVQALLFLFYNPNLEDPLCPIISPDMTEEEFSDNVKISLEGGEIDSLTFQTNYGFLENEIVKKTEVVEKDNNETKETYSDVTVDLKQEKQETEENDSVQQETENLGGSIRNDNRCDTNDTLTVEQDTIDSEGVKTLDKDDKTKEQGFDNSDNSNTMRPEHGSTATKLTKTDLIKLDIATDILPSRTTSTLVAKKTLHNSCLTLDSLVPYNVFISVLCSYLVRHVYIGKRDWQS